MRSAWEAGAWRGGWTEVKAAYLRAKALGGAGDDPVSRAVGAMGLLADRVGGVETTISQAAARIATQPQ